MLVDNRECLERISEYLYEHETITGKEFMRIFREIKGIPEPEEENGKKSFMEQALEAEGKLPVEQKPSVELVAERAGISRATLWAVEKGSSSVAMGIYAAVLHALNGMDEDLLLIAKDDELGRKLQDMDLKVRKRAPRN